MPASSTTSEHRPQPDELLPLSIWVRGLLLLLAGGLATVFGIAVWLNPYDDEGEPMRMATHRKLGLPPCTFNDVTGMPCPSCGMTTSFSLLMHGDIVNSLRANWVGTLLATACLLFIPWALVSVWRRKTLFFSSLDWPLMLGLLVLMVLMLLRWVLVVGLGWIPSGPPPT